MNTQEVLASEIKVGDVIYSPHFGSGKYGRYDSYKTVVKITVSKTGRYQFYVSTKQVNLDTNEVLCYDGPTKFANGAFTDRLITIQKR